MIFQTALHIVSCADYSVQSLLIMWFQMTYSSRKKLNLCVWMTLNEKSRNSRGGLFAVYSTRRCCNKCCCLSVLLVLSQSGLLTSVVLD